MEVLDDSASTWGRAWCPLPTDHAGRSCPTTGGEALVWRRPSPRLASICRSQGRQIRPLRHSGQLAGEAIARHARWQTRYQARGELVIVARRNTLRPAMARAAAGLPIPCRFARLPREERHSSFDAFIARGYNPGGFWLRRCRGDQRASLRIPLLTLRHQVRLAAALFPGRRTRSLSRMPRTGHQARHLSFLHLQEQRGLDEGGRWWG